MGIQWLQVNYDGLTNKLFSQTRDSLSEYGYVSREAESRRKPILHIIKKMKIRKITLFTSVLRGIIAKVLSLFTIVYYEFLSKSPEFKVLHMNI